MTERPDRSGLPISIGDALLVEAELRPEDAATQAAIERLLGLERTELAPGSPTALWQNNEPPALAPAPLVPPSAPPPGKPAADVDRPRPEERAAFPGAETTCELVERLELTPPVGLQGTPEPFEPAAGSDGSAPPPPLFAPLHARAILGASLATVSAGSELDVERALATLSQARSLDEVPYLPVHTLRRGVQVLLDSAPALDPIREDVDALCGELLKLFGPGKIELLRFAHCPSSSGSARRGVWSDREGKRIPWRAPGPAMPVLVVSDFTLSPADTDGPVATLGDWLQFAREVRGIRLRSGCARCPCPQPLAASARPIDDVRALERTHQRTPGLACRSRKPAPRGVAPMNDRVQRRLAQLEVHSPYTIRLAELVSLAVRVDAGLLRRMRQRLLPDADVSVESELWFSPLVASRSRTGFQMGPDVLAELRSRLRSAPGRPSIAEVRGVLAEAHVAASPAIRLEEALNGLALEQGAQARDAIDAALRPALHVLAAGGKGASDVARWVLHATPRLEPLVRETPNAQTLMLAASLLLRMHRRVKIQVVNGAVGIAGIRWALSTLDAGTRGLDVELLAGGLAFRQPSGAKPMLLVPATDPLLVEIEWPSESQRQRLLTEAAPGTFVSLTGDPSMVHVTTLSGDRYEVTRQHPPPPLKSDDSEYLGAQLERDGGLCRFRLWAPHANEVVIELMDDASHGSARTPSSIRHRQPMQKVSDGFWKLIADAVRPGQRYRYAITNRGEPYLRTDPAARSLDMTGDPSEPPLAVVKDARRVSRYSKAPAPKDLIIYELHVGTFSGRNDGNSGPGTFAQTARHLHHIADLGFNAICLLPVQVNGRPGWGFDPIHLFAVETGYGSPSDLEAFTDQAHEVGLCVLLTVVFSHASNEQNTLWEFDGAREEGGIYYERGGDTPWARGFAWHKPEVQDFMFQQARMWLEEYGMDGLLFDSLRGVDRRAFGHVLARLRSEFPEHLLLGEEDPSGAPLTSLHAEVSTSAYPELRRSLHDGDFNRLEGLLKWDVHTSASRFIKSLLGVHHDAGGDGGRYLIDELGGRENTRARAQCRLAWALNVTLPTLPWLFMGSECHMGSPELPGGRWGYPSTEGDGRFDWSVVEREPARQMQRLVRRVNSLRREYPELTGNTFQLTHRDETNRVFAFKRWAADAVTLTVVNFGDRNFDGLKYGVRTGEQPGDWFETLCTQGVEFGGWEGAGNQHEPRLIATQSDHQVYINLPAWSVVCLALATGNRRPPDLNAV